MPLSLLKVDTPSNRPSCPAIRDIKTPKHKKKTDLFISLFILLQKNPKKSLVLFQLKVIFFSSKICSNIHLLLLLMSKYFTS